MSAFAETLKIEWKNAGISVCTVQSVIGTELANRGGKLCGHVPKNYLLRSRTVVDILQCLYVDDGAVIFMTRANLTEGIDLMYKHFVCFGLEMHRDPPPRQNVSPSPLKDFLIHTYLHSNREALTLTMSSKLNMMTSSPPKIHTRTKSKDKTR
jgi:hypothetical protein